MPFCVNSTQQHHKRVQSCQLDTISEDSQFSNGENRSGVAGHSTKGYAPDEYLFMAKHILHNEFTAIIERAEAGAGGSSARR